MATLTEAQADLLAWIIKDASGEFLFDSTVRPPSVMAKAGGSERPVHPPDLHELQAQDLVRPVSGILYEVTNDGREVYEQLKNPPPPPERPPVGFRPN